MPKLFDRVKVNIATTGTGDVTFGSAVSNAFLTPTEAGCADTDTVRYVIVDGTDYEEGIGTIKSSVAAMARTTVTKSKISGTAGTTKLNLSGTAVIAFIASAADIVNAASVTTVGNALLTAADAAAGQTAIGGTTVGKALFTATDAAAARGTLGVVFPPQGRLTLATGTPVMTSSQSSKTTIYYTSYIGNMIPIYDGSNMVPTAFSEISVATTDTTKNPAAIGASKVNDWFVWNDGGTIRLSHGPDWTNDTTRSAGTALTMVNGILLNNASITNGPAASRGTYVGTTRSDGSSTLNWVFGDIAIDGTAALLGVWNTYNRRPVFTTVANASDSWTYGTAAWRSPNGSATYRVQAVMGLNEDPISAVYNAFASAGSGVTARVGVGINSTSAFSGLTDSSPSGAIASLHGSYKGYLGIGYSFITALEFANGSSVTFFGDGGAPTQVQTGLQVELFM